MATRFPSYEKAVDAKLCFLFCPGTPVASDAQKSKQDQELINSIAQLKQQNFKVFLQKLYGSPSHFKTSPHSWWLKISSYIIGAAAQFKGRERLSDLEQD